MKKLFKIAGLLLGGFALIQLIPVDRTNPPVSPSENFIEVHHTPKPIEQTLRKACYDCHSNETIYPPYAKIAPISWAIKNHINEGREHLNFSIWGTYNKDLKRSMMDNAISEIKENKMPLPSYITKHPEANLTAQEKQELTTYFEEILRKEGL